MRIVTVLAFIVALFVSCDSPTAPRMDGRWALTADASPEGGYCILSMAADVTGTLDSFSGSGELNVTTAGEFSVSVAELTGNRRTVAVGDFTLSVDVASIDLVSGSWQCDGATGAWRMERS